MEREQLETEERRVEINPCNLPIDIFYQTLKSYEKIEDAIKVIKSCDREEEFLLSENYGMLMNLWEEFRDSLLMKNYDDLVDLFNRERKLLKSVYSNLDFWKDKLLYDASKWKTMGVRDIGIYLTSLINKEYTILAAIILSNYHKNSLKDREFYVNNAKITYTFNKKHPFKLYSKPRSTNPLHRAAIKRNHLLFELLLKKMNPTIYGTDLIYTITHNEDIEMARILMSDKRMHTSKIIAYIKENDYDKIFEGTY